MFLKGSKATELQGESKDLVWPLDSRTIFLVHLSLSLTHGFLATCYISFLLP